MTDTKKYEFVEEEDKYVGDVIYYTRDESGLIPDTLSHNYQKAYEKFTKLQGLEPSMRYSVRVIETFYAPKE